MSDDLLWAMLGANRGHHAMRLNQHDGKRVTAWVPVGRRAWFQSVVADFSWIGDIEIAARPFLDRGSFRLNADAGAVWAKTETGKQVDALEAFPVEPTLILREGGSPRHVAFWAVRKGLSPDDGEKVCRHLAHRLRTPKKHSQQLWFAPEGAVIRSGKRPTIVSAVGGNGELYGVRQIAVHLPREIPNPDAWRGVAAN